MSAETVTIAGGMSPNQLAPGNAGWALEGNRTLLAGVPEPDRWLPSVRHAKLSKCCLRVRASAHELRIAIINRVHLSSLQNRRNMAVGEGRCETGDWLALHSILR